MKCSWCGSGPVKRHHDPEKARKGYTLCGSCNMVHSPEATIKGSFAYWNEEQKKIITGVRK